MTSERRLGMGLALVTAGISGVAVWLNGHAITRFADATAYTTVKNLVAAALLVGLLIAAGRVRPEEGWRPPRTPRQWTATVAVGAIGGGLAFVLFFEGLARATSTDAAFIHKSLVLWVALLAVPLLGERLGLLQVGAIALLLVGQALLADGVGLDAGSGGLLLLGATWCWAAEVVVAKRLLVEVSSATLGVARMVIGSVLLVGWVLLTDGFGPLGADQLGWALLTGAVLAAYVATWFAALARAPAVDVTAVLVPAAVLTAVIAKVVDGAALGDGLGLVLLLVGGATALAAGLRPAARPA